MGDIHPLECDPAVFFDHLDLFRDHLVNNGTDDLHASLLKDCFVQGDFVDGTADAAAGHDDDLGVEAAGHIRIG